MQRKMIYLAIQAIGYYDPTLYYPKDPTLVGKNFDFFRGMHG